jgi:hypothetical protein
MRPRYLWHGTRTTRNRRGLRHSGTLFLALTALAILVAGCGRAVDGRKVFLQSELAVNKVQSFRARIETFGSFAKRTDAQYDCGHSVSHYIENDENLQRKIECVQTQWIQFSRLVGTERWNAVRQSPDLGVCNRLRNGEPLGQVPVRLFSADEGRIVPPFFYYANETTPTTITPAGKEVIEGHYCDIWKIQDRDPAFPMHTIWIGAEDRLPRKYLEGEPENPRGVVTYSDYGASFTIDVPPDTFAR